MSLSCFTGTSITNLTHDTIDIEYVINRKRNSARLAVNFSHCISPEEGQNLNATVHITPRDNYRIVMSGFFGNILGPIATIKTKGTFNLTNAYIRTNAYIYLDSHPGIGSFDSGASIRPIDRMKIRSLILRDSTETIIEPYGPSEYNTRTNVTDTPFSAIIMDPIIRVQVYGRSRDSAFYISMLVMMDLCNYATEIIEEYTTPNVTLSVTTGTDRLFMLKTSIESEWSVHTMIS